MAECVCDPGSMPARADLKSSTPTTLSTIVVHSGCTRILVVLLQSESRQALELRVTEMTPALQDVVVDAVDMHSLANAAEMKQQHDQVLQKLAMKQTPVEGLLDQADQLISGQPSKIDVYAAMAESLARSWAQLNSQLNQRRQLHEKNVDFARQSQALVEAMQQAEETLADTSVPKTVQQAQQMLDAANQTKRSLLELSRAALLAGNTLLQEIFHASDENIVLDARGQHNLVEAQSAGSKVERGLEQLHDRRCYLDHLHDARASVLQHWLSVLTVNCELESLQARVDQYRSLLSQHNNLGDSVESVRYLMSEFSQLPPAIKLLQDSAIRVLRRADLLTKSYPNTSDDTPRNTAFSVLDACAQLMMDTELRQRHLSAAAEYFSLHNSAECSLRSLAASSVATEIIDNNYKQDDGCNVAESAMSPDFPTIPTTVPTTIPTTIPTVANANTLNTLPTAVPTTVPTAVPTTVPTAVPTAVPTRVCGDILPVEFEQQLDTVRMMANRLISSASADPSHNVLTQGIADSRDKLTKLAADVSADIATARAAEQKNAEQKQAAREQKLQQIQQYFAQLDQKVHSFTEPDSTCDSVDFALQNNTTISAQLQAMLDDLTALEQKRLSSGFQTICTELRANAEALRHIIDARAKFLLALADFHSGAKNLQLLLNSILDRSSDTQNQDSELLEFLNVSKQKFKRQLAHLSRATAEIHQQAAEQQNWHNASSAVAKIHEHFEQQRSIIDGRCEQISSAIYNYQHQRHKLQDLVSKARLARDANHTLLVGLFPVLVAFEHGNIARLLRESRYRCDTSAANLHTAQEHLLSLSANVEALTNTESMQDEVNDLASLIAAEKRELSRAAKKYRTISQAVVTYLKNIKNLECSLERYSQDNQWKSCGNLALDGATHESSHALLASERIIEDQLKSCSEDLGVIMDQLRSAEPPTAADQDHKILQQVHDLMQAKWTDTRQSFRDSIDKQMRLSRLKNRSAEAKRKLEELEMNLARIQTQSSGESRREVLATSEMFGVFEEEVKIAEQQMEELVNCVPLAGGKSEEPVEWRRELEALAARWLVFNDKVRQARAMIDCAVDFFTTVELAEDWYQKGGRMLIDIAKRSTRVEHVEQVHQLRSDIQDFLQQGQQEQDQRIGQLTLLVPHLPGTWPQRRVQAVSTQTDDILTSFRVIDQELDSMIGQMLDVQLRPEDIEDVEETTSHEHEYQHDEMAQAGVSTSLQSLHAGEMSKEEEERLSESTRDLFEQIICDKEVEALDETSSSAAPKDLAGDIPEADKIQASFQPASNIQQHQSLIGSCGFGTSSELVPTLSFEESMEPCAPEFSQPLCGLSAELGFSVQLFAMVTGFPLPLVSWFRDGECVDSCNEYFITQNNGRCTLRIDQLICRDVATFSCVASNVSGRAKTQAQVTLKGGEVPCISGMPASLQVVPGGTLVLQCSVSGCPVPLVHWLYKGTPVQQSAQVQFISDDGQTHTLRIAEVDASHLGRYTIVAHNLLGEVESSCLVSTKKSSVVTIMTQEHLSEMTTRQATLVSSEAGPIVFEDHKTDGEKDQDDVARVTEVSSAKDLVDSVASAQKTHAPKFISPIEGSILKEGENLLLQTVFSGRPHPEVVWRKNGVVLHGEEEDRVNVWHDYNHARLSVSGVDGCNAGSYSCSLSNVAGNASCSADVIVRKRQMRPVFDHRLASHTTRIAHRAVLEVSVSAIPAASVRWLKDGQPIVPDSRLTVVQDGGRHSLIIEPVEICDGGSYTAEATNSAGQSTCSAVLTVQTDMDEDISNQDQDNLNVQQQANSTKDSASEKQHFQTSQPSSKTLGETYQSKTNQLKNANLQYHILTDQTSVSPNILTPHAADVKVTNGTAFSRPRLQHCHSPTTPKSDAAGDCMSPLVQEEVHSCETEILSQREITERQVENQRVFRLEDILYRDSRNASKTLRAELPVDFNGEQKLPSAESDSNETQRGFRLFITLSNRYVSRLERAALIRPVQALRNTHCHLMSDTSGPITSDNVDRTEHTSSNPAHVLCSQPSTRTLQLTNQTPILVKVLHKQPVVRAINPRLDEGERSQSGNRTAQKMMDGDSKILPHVLRKNVATNSKEILSDRAENTTGSVMGEAENRTARTGGRSARCSDRGSRLPRLSPSRGNRPSDHVVLGRSGKPTATSHNRSSVEPSSGSGRFSTRTSDLADPEGTSPRTTLISRRPSPQPGVGSKRSRLSESTLTHKSASIVRKNETVTSEHSTIYTSTESRKRHVTSKRDEDVEGS